MEHIRLAIKVNELIETYNSQMDIYDLKIEELEKRILHIEEDKAK